MEKGPKKDQNSSVGVEHILRNVHFRDLEIFETIARLGSVSAAARELRLQTPHVSKSLKRVELAAKGIFFQRSKSGVTLTPQGRSFLDFSQNLSKLISSTTWNETSKINPDKKRLLTIAGTSYLANYLLGPALSKIKLNENRYRFRLVEMGERQLLSLGIKNTFEIAIHTRKLDWPKSWTTSVIGGFSWTLCGRSGHPLGSATHEMDVKKYPFIIPVSLNAGEFRHGEDQCPLPMRQRIHGDETQTAEAGLQLVAETDQLIYVPETMVRKRIEQKQLQKIKVRDWRPVSETLFLSAHGESVPQRLFEQLIQECAKINR